MKAALGTIHVHTLLVDPPPEYNNASLGIYEPSKWHRRPGSIRSKRGALVPKHIGRPIRSTHKRAAYHREWYRKHRKVA